MLPPTPFRFRLHAAADTPFKALIAADVSLLPPPPLMTPYALLPIFAARALIAGIFRCYFFHMLTLMLLMPPLMIRQRC